MSNLTVDQFRAALPMQMKKGVSQELIDNINDTLKGEPEFLEAYRDNLIGYTHVMRDGKFKMEQYISAVKYVSHKVMGCSNIQAYTKTFPERYQRFIETQTSQKDISRYVAGYNKNKLVNLVFEQTLIPTHILNADLHQQALNVQAALMMDEDVSPKVRSDAANSLLTHLKVPEGIKVEMEVTHKEDSMVRDLKDVINTLSAKQRTVIEDGVYSPMDIAHADILTMENFDDAD